ncbi:hypothetical protein ZOSMA_7G01630 [Zostera marina]|uniref:AMP-dependent synthetase/ligase domain-containing protein n=1 Tax=Zostera marina TaxID=29655 RepID=A0A0K9NPZ6_ZOSMR|nr:hypothetical protein ZOSMA_7G01630 [Zostera marina]
MFHILGFSKVLVGAVLGDTTVIMKRVKFHDMLRIAGRCGATSIICVPPILVMMARSKQNIISHYNLKSLNCIVTGGAPVSELICQIFTSRYPSIQIEQVNQKKSYIIVNA